MRRLLAVLVLLSAVSCGGSNSSNNNSLPTVPTPQPTRVINVTGDLNFGQVTVGDAQTRFITIANSGTGTLSVTGITGPCGGFFTVSWTGGTISAGSSQTVSMRFAPTAVQNCTGVVTVNGDQTTGTNTIAVIANVSTGYSRNLT